MCPFVGHGFCTDLRMTRTDVLVMAGSCLIIEAAPAGGKDGGPSLSGGVGAPLIGAEAGIFYDFLRFDCWHQRKVHYPTAYSPRFPLIQSCVKIRVDWNQLDLDGGRIYLTRRTVYHYRKKAW